MKKYYTTKEVATSVNRSRASVERWLRERGTDSIRVRGKGGRGGGVYLVPARDIQMLEDSIVLKHLLPTRVNLVALELYEERLYNEILAIEEIKSLIKDMEL